MSECVTCGGKKERGNTLVLRSTSTKLHELTLVCRSLGIFKEWWAIFISVIAVVWVVIPHQILNGLTVMDTWPLIATHNPSLMQKIQ